MNLGNLVSLPYVYVRLYPSIIFLVIANLIPLYGVLVLGWDLFTVMILFWLETVVVGIYGLLRIIVVTHILSIFLVPFFVIHFGMFMLGHLLFLTSFFGDETVFVSKGFLGLVPFAFALAVAHWPVVGGFIVSHGYSFVYNFLSRKEYVPFNAGQLMTLPYRRVIIMHITIIFGGMLIIAFSSEVVGVLLLLILKLVTDIWLHIREHASAQKRTT